MIQWWNIWSMWPRLQSSALGKCQNSHPGWKWTRPWQHRTLNYVRVHFFSNEHIDWTPFYSNCRPVLHSASSITIACCCGMHWTDGDGCCYGCICNMKTRLGANTWNAFHVLIAYCTTVSPWRILVWYPCLMDMRINDQTFNYVFPLLCFPAMVESLHDAAYKNTLCNSLYCPDHMVGNIHSEHVSHFQCYSLVFILMK